MHLRFNWRLVSIRFIHDRLETYLRSRTRGGQSYRNRIKINTEDLSPPTRALNWVRSCELATGGISVDYYSQKAYPEVTGYLLPTLYAVRRTRSRIPVATMVALRTEKGRVIPRPVGHKAPAARFCFSLRHGVT